MSKDSRVAWASTTVRVWAMALDASALDSIDDLLANGDYNYNNQHYYYYY